jgi:hypothetical protein
VHVLGEQLGRVELQALRRKIGHVNPRHPLRSPLPVRDIVLTGITGSIELPLRWQPTAQESARAGDLIDLLGLGAKAEARWDVLSQGERGRVLIAGALICEPRLLLLDEPSTGLDIAAREQLLETVDLLTETHPDMASSSSPTILKNCLPPPRTRCSSPTGGWWRPGRRWPRSAQRTCRRPSRTRSRCGTRTAAGPRAPPAAPATCRSAEEPCFRQTCLFRMMFVDRQTGLPNECDGEWS